MSRWASLCMLFWCCGLVSGCFGPGTETGPALVAPRKPATPALHPGDRLHITVFGEDKLSGDYDVNSAGSIVMPLAGTIPAAGSTALELQKIIAARLSGQYLRNPQVTVGMLSERPFYILGEVEKPGEYPYREGIDIWRAMALAGGQTYRASRSTVLIQQAGETEWREHDLAEGLIVGPGDAIRVPERWF